MQVIAISVIYFNTRRIRSDLDWDLDWKKSYQKLHSATNTLCLRKGVASPVSITVSNWGVIAKFALKGRRGVRGSVHLLTAHTLTHSCGFTREWLGSTALYTSGFTKLWLTFSNIALVWIKFLENTCEYVVVTKYGQVGGAIMVFSGFQKSIIILCQ